MCSSTSTLGRILVKSLVKSGKGKIDFDGVVYLETYIQSVSWLRSELCQNEWGIKKSSVRSKGKTTQRRHQKLIVKQITGQYVSSWDSERSRQWTTVEFFLSSQIDRNERFETDSDSNIKVISEMITCRSEKRKELRISLTRKSEIVQILEYNSWWINMKTDILSAQSSYLRHVSSSKTIYWS